MGRPKKTVRTIITTAEPEETAESDAVETDVDVIRALTELDGADTLTWQVHRLNHPNPGYCDPPLSTAELTLERIAKDFGPGRYQVKGIKPDGTYYKSARITIASRPTAAAPAVDLSALTKTQDMMPLILAMMNQNTQVITSALARPEAGKGFPTEALLTALPALLVAAKEFFKSPGGKDPTEQLLTAVELVERLKSESASKTGATWVDLLRDALPTMGGAVKDVLAARAPPVAMVPAIAAPSSEAAAAPAPAVMSAPAAEQPGAKLLDPVWQRNQIAYLIEKARLQRDVGLYVDLILDEIPGFVSPELIIQQLERADWWQVLVTFEPAIAPYQAWFDTLRRNLIQAIQEEAGKSA